MGHLRYVRAVRSIEDGVVVRLIDKLVHHVLRPQGWNPVLVDVGNVAQYYYEGTEKEVFDWQRDFPNIAPPWPQAVYGLRSPRRLLSEGKEINVRDGGRELAVSMLAVDLRDPSEVEAVRTYLQKRKIRISDLRLEQARWFMKLMLYGDAGFPNPSYGMIVMVDHNGQYLHPSPEARFAFLNPRGLVGEDANYITNGGEIFVEPVMLAISFLHCKNTTVQDVPPPPKLAKRTLERYGIPMNTCKVLNISPMTKIMSGAAGNGASLVKRLHICRGHFKDYRERGLFGKERGLFWWSQHVRGEKAAGSVTNEYNVQVAVPPR